MNTLTKKIFIFLAIGLFSSGWMLHSQNYVAIAKDGNVYDEANAKYITLNQDNEEVSVIPGMVFATAEHTPGWYKVEYSPGLHAFVPEPIVSTNFNQLKAGNYDIKNNPGQSLTVEGSGDNWTGITNGQKFKGEKWKDIIVFLDDNNNIAFSLVDIGNGPVAITYDNSVTKFF